MDPLVWGDMLPLMVLLDTDVVRMLKMALPPLAMPPPPSLFFPDAALAAMVLWLIETVPKKLTMPPPAWLALLPDTVLRLSWRVPPLFAIPPPSRPATFWETVVPARASVPPCWL